jgi:hypothetical protein
MNPGMNWSARHNLRVEATQSLNYILTRALLPYRHDFYQTPSTVIASFFLKKIDKDRAKVAFDAQKLDLDLPTTDTPTPKRYKKVVSLWGPVDPAKSSFKILGTKLEVTLAKADGSSWPVLRSEDRVTGEILQVGRAGRLQ